MRFFHSFRVSKNIGKTAVSSFTHIPPTMNIVGIVVGIHRKSGQVGVIEHHCDNIGTGLMNGRKIVRFGGSITTPERAINFYVLLLILFVIGCGVREKAAV